MSTFIWNKKKTLAALSLADGHTNIEAAEAAGVNEKSIRRWKLDIEFEAEVDRLSCMTGLSSRAERLRTVKRLAREKLAKSDVLSEKTTLLDYLKFAQSETDGVKLDLAKMLAAITDEEVSVASSGPGGTTPNQDPGQS
jgi:transposase-like protein